jgi:hypothetical protein
MAGLEPGLGVIDDLMIVQHGGSRVSTRGVWAQFTRGLTTPLL